MKIRNLEQDGVVYVSILDLAQDLENALSNCFGLSESEKAITDSIVADMRLMASQPDVFGVDE